MSKILICSAAAAAFALAVPAAFAQSPNGQERERPGQTIVQQPAATLPPAKQDKIRAAVRRENVEKIGQVNFDVRIGAVVPPRYHFHPLPAEVVADVPEYRGHEYIVAKDDIVIVQPDSHKIVYVLADSRSASMDGPAR